MEYLPLFKTNKERNIFILLSLSFFIFNISIEYQNYKNFIKEEVFNTSGQIINIYNKKNSNVLKVKTKHFTFFTSIDPNTNVKIFDTINLYVISDNITFLSYLQSMYLKSFNLSKIHTQDKTKKEVYNIIHTQHSSLNISSLYSALYIATPLNQTMREFSSNLGISHLIAISGFHLAVMSYILYTILNVLYSKIHQSFFPYRNKKYDILLVSSFLLFFYLYFLDMPPSLLRSYVMFIFALFLFRNNIKIVSFETLFLISVLIIAFFPKLLFSLSLWFSISGVFYIFLFIQYFNKLHKYIQFLLFNFWIYLAMNPITHYFFPSTSIEQLYSPIITILFTIFYPISVILHILNKGDILDFFLNFIINLDIQNIDVYTDFWILVFYISVSLLAIKYKTMFIVLNIFLIIYSIWLFDFVI